MPTNRYGNTKVTKDGQSREMRQRMARGRRARGERGMTSAPSEGRKVTTNNTTNNVNSLRNAGRTALSMGSKAGVVASVFNQGTSKNDTQSSQGVQPYKPVKKVKYPTASETQAEERRRNSAKDFDRAFAAARRAGKKTFTWRGKSYNTKLK
jgi:hypothetical protein